MVSADTIDTRSFLSAVGPNFRAPTPGPEHDLVSQFLAERLAAPRPGIYRQIFIEPQIDSGYPDVVLVEIDVSRTVNWPMARSRLTQFDLRLFHFIWLMAEVHTSTVPPSFAKSLDASLSRLESAYMITRDGPYCRAKPIEQVSALTSLVALEAKIRDWRNGLRQASLNAWFAPVRYLLMPKLPRNATALRHAATDNGVGLITVDDELGSAAMDMPDAELHPSYLSWQFNEWAWMSSLEEDGPHWERAQ